MAWGEEPSLKRTRDLPPVNIRPARQPPRPPAATVAAPQARPACLQTRGYATWLGSAY